jgi:glycosyltransferase involved in cell wall biosynthesis
MKYMNLNLLYESKPAVSIIIPAYNAEDTIMHTLANVKRVISDIALDYEVIVVNDGASDGTVVKIYGIYLEYVLCSIYHILLA